MPSLAASASDTGHPARMIVAGVLGDAVDCAIRRELRPAVFSKESGRLLRKDYLLKAQHFYDKHGGKAIILARFVPIVRTFAPFRCRHRPDEVQLSSPTSTLSVPSSGSSVSLWQATSLGGIPIIKKNFEATIILHHLRVPPPYHH